MEAPLVSRRCILLFARTAGEEARAKRLPRARGVFALARRRIVAAAAALPGVDLLIVGGGGALPQRGEGFAERLANAFADAAARGYREIVAVPTDVPRLGARQLAAAFRGLQGAETVLGPAADGGAYLIGCRGGFATLFAGVRWRTSFAFADLAGNASSSGAPAVLGPLEDVDAQADLLALDVRGDRELAALLAAACPRGPEDVRRAVPAPLCHPLANRPPPPSLLSGPSVA
jgi:2-phospho-L-lactate guanylyltransferase (CobY/MobA/RfbA family)